MKKKYLISMILLAAIVLSSCSINSIEKNDSHTITSKIDETSVFETTIESISETSISTIVDLPYTAAFYNYDYELLLSFKVSSEEDAIYTGEEPKRMGNDEFRYEFIGFVKDDSLDGDFSYIATFKEVPKKDWDEINWF